MTGGEGTQCDPTHYFAFRSLVARACYLASERPDAAYAVMELSRKASFPDALSWAAAKKLARYMVEATGAVWRSPLATTRTDTIVVFADSDYAGQDSGNITSGMIAMSGGSVGIKAGSWAQATIALSVAEAETVALAKAAVECLGLAALAEEPGWGTSGRGSFPGGVVGRRRWEARARAHQRTLDPTGGPPAAAGSGEGSDRVKPRGPHDEVSADQRAGGAARQGGHQDQHDVVGSRFGASRHAGCQGRPDDRARPWRRATGSSDACFGVHASRTTRLEYGDCRARVRAGRNHDEFASVWGRAKPLRYGTRDGMTRRARFIVRLYHIPVARH